MSAGELSAFVFYAVLAAGAVGAISEVAGDVLRAAGAAERLFELLDAEPTVQAPHCPAVLPTPVSGSLTVEGVRFAYPSRPELPALLDVDLAVEPGERLALVGPSGSGKSTLLGLVLRFYDPQAGRLSSTGSICAPWIRGSCGNISAWSPQEPVLFTGDAWSNLRYGRPEASDAEVRRAAEAAHCGEFLARLPRGFATPLGPGGVQLSGGERQRIAIARAILRDPALLLLDEATSSLDAESEQRVQEALGRLMVGRTTIVIAHRLATVTAADRIAVLDRGRLVALGPHRQLLRDSELYARLAALQLTDPGTAHGTGTTEPAHRASR
ncbi:MAG: ATP-binding cassette domain-containing protein [Arhodomonas sp.]|nr:ATP-binding cassette domain-containing protein [Arhodomonas sp.]